MDLSSKSGFNLGDRKPFAMELAPLLEREIITRRLRPGERLTELDLCARFGVSRSPMREALHLLEEGLLVVRKPRFGVRVAPMTLDNLDNIYACRAPLEALAAAGIASAPRRERIVAALCGCIERMKAAAAANEIEACFFANVELTDILHEQSGNSVLTSLLGRVNKAALRYRHWSYWEAPTVISLSIEANQQMVEAIRGGKPKRAESVTRGLVLESWSRTRLAFESRSAD